ncbi:hypothetical protein ACROYT_G038758 [Oculina patagonica]
MSTVQASYRPCLQLEVKVLRGRDISVGYSDYWDTPDPYVKLFIPTAPNGRRQTKVKNNTKNPKWNQTFQFFLDPQVKNHLEITLVESDSGYSKDDVLETKTYYLSALELDKSYQHTFTFGEASKVDVEMKAAVCTAPADMRYSIELCDEEKAFIQKRKKLVFEAMKKVFGEQGPKNLSEVPTIAILGSGGGFRAMVGLSGVFCALQDLGLLDCAMYTAGLSGSTWYLSTLYSHPKWPEIHPKVVRNELRADIQDSWMWLLLTPSWLYKHVGIIKQKYRRGQPISFTDFFGYLVGDMILKKRRKRMPRLSDQQRVLEDALAPFPLYTCVHVKKDVSAQQYFEWMEFSPYEIGMAKYGTFMKTKQFGSKFFCGKLLTSYKEPPLHYLQGLWGSAFTILLQRILGEEKPPEDNAAIVQGIGDLRTELQEMVDSDEIVHMDGTKESDIEEEPDETEQDQPEQDQPEQDQPEHDQTDNGETDGETNEEPMELDGEVDSSLSTRALEYLMDRFPVLKTREGRAGLVHNYLRGLQLLSAPVPSDNEAVSEAADQLAVKSKRIYLVDSGLVFNSPYPLLLRPQRNVDIFLSFDFSAREKDNQMPFQELLLAEEWAKKNNLKFPPIDAEEQYKKYGMKEFYVFRHPTDPSCPIVMHFVLVNKTFREQSAPGVERKTKKQKSDGDFSIFEDPEGWFSTFNFRYPKEQFNRLADLSYFNTLLGEQTIKDVIAEWVNKLRA